MKTFLDRCMRGPLLALQPLLEGHSHAPQWHCPAMLAGKCDWEPCEPQCAEPGLQLWGSQRWQWLEALGQSAQSGHCADPLHPENQAQPPSGAAHCPRLSQGSWPQCWQSRPCMAELRISMIAIASFDEPDAQARIHSMLFIFKESWQPKSCMGSCRPTLFFELTPL